MKTEKNVCQAVWIILLCAGTACPENVVELSNTGRLRERVYVK